MENSFNNNNNQNNLNYHKGITLREKTNTGNSSVFNMNNSIRTNNSLNYSNTLNQSELMEKVIKSLKINNFSYKLLFLID